MRSIVEQILWWFTE